MKNLLALVFTLMAFMTNAQDIITKNDGTDIQAKVLEISKTEVRFKKLDNLDGPTYVENVNDLLMVRPSKGAPIVFKKEAIQPPLPVPNPVIAVAATPVPTPQIAPQVVVQPQQITPQPTVIASNNEPSSDKMCDKGAQDARVYYTGKNSGATAVNCISILASPLAGLITAAIVVGTKPSYDNLNVPTPSLLRNTDYMGCYQNEAYTIKKKKVWTNWGIGSAAFVLVYLLVGSSSSN